MGERFAAAKLVGAAAQRRIGQHPGDRFSEILGIDHAHLAVGRIGSRIDAVLHDLAPLDADVLHEHRRLDDGEGETGFDHRLLDPQLGRVVVHFGKLRVEGGGINEVFDASRPRRLDRANTDLRLVLRETGRNQEHRIRPGDGARATSPSERKSPMTVSETPKPDRRSAERGLEVRARMRAPIRER